MLSYDEKINKYFFYWLVTSFSLVFLMVIVGGLTRLTNSGLSITEWELIEGILPPLSSQEWLNYFALYKKIPQYKILNTDMTLNEFKIIFYWEYFHRILGRLIGLIFLLPLVYFYLVKKIDKKYLRICSFVLFLIVFQGLVGWYMVKSGLVNNITVSHYRLSLHLTTAFFIIAIIFWMILNLKHKTFKKFFINKKKNYIFYLFFFFIFLQIIVGAFVSGLDAGKIYQTWPMMNYTYFPDDVNIVEIFDLFNFENHGLIQFYHRNIAYLIILYSLIIGFYIFRNNLNYLKKPFYYVSIFLIFQIILGIITLVSGLNIYLASAHQIFSLLLTLSVINLYYCYIN
tara:strand:- start:110 stop:1135 length:1026 start_codon:yes stop_codon:yes gene_type:complete